MLALTRAAPKRVPRLTTSRLTIRSFAEVVGVPPGEASTSIALQNPGEVRPRRERIHRERVPIQPVKPVTDDGIPVREDHGLYGFFRRKDEADLVGAAKYEVVETPENMQKQTGWSLNLTCDHVF